MGYEGVWVMRGMGYERDDCNVSLRTAEMSRRRVFSMDAGWLVESVDTQWRRRHNCEPYQTLVGLEDWKTAAAA